jgi:MoxR-like ATPase
MITSENESGQALGGDSYIPDDDLVAAAQVAMVLGQPLLLTGEPGTGKSTFAQHVARTLAPHFFAAAGTGNPGAYPLYVFETKSTSVATDLFYRFDNMGRFHATHDNPIHYIAFEALGQAILESLPRSAVADLLTAQSDHRGPRRSIVLIDEIDKAPRDFPNDLLNEIEQMFFRIPELPIKDGKSVRTVSAAPALRPVVILTSNSEKNLPAPFLRRCVFHHIRFPDRSNAKRLRSIIHANLAGGSSVLSESAIDFFYSVREDLVLDKLPTTSELIQWIRILHARQPFADGVRVRDLRLADLPPAYVKVTLGVLAKTASDLARIEEFSASLAAAAKRH